VFRCGHGRRGWSAAPPTLTRCCYKDRSRHSFAPFPPSAATSFLLFWPSLPPVESVATCCHRAPSSTTLALPPGAPQCLPLWCRAPPPRAPSHPCNVVRCLAATTQRGRPRRGPIHGQRLAPPVPWFFPTAPPMPIAKPATPASISLRSSSASSKATPCFARSSLVTVAMTSSRGRDPIVGQRDTAPSLPPCEPKPEPKPPWPSPTPCPDLGHGEPCSILTIRVVLLPLAEQQRHHLSEAVDSVELFLYRW
jgi:hypothetical protein